MKTLRKHYDNAVDFYRNFPHFLYEDIATVGFILVVIAVLLIAG